jgi:flap endonuclease-1
MFVGVDISAIIKDLKHEKELSDFSKKTIAFDAYNVIYQFLASIRQQDGTPLMDLKGNITSHLSGLFYRTIRLITIGIKPIFVFDGKPPAFKKVLLEREKEKRMAEALMEKAKLQEIEEEQLLYSKQSLKLTKKMVEESINLLEALGVPCVIAESEGEAQAAYMVKKGIAHYSASQDYDSLLFGSPMLVRNLSISEKRKLPRRDEYVVIKPEVIILDEVLNNLEISLDQLIMIGIIIGTDFNEGVKGIGSKTALKIVKQYKNVDDVKKHIKEKYNAEIDNFDEVFEFFKNPPVKDVVLENKEINEEMIVKILVEEHDFSEERIKNAIAELKDAKQKERQTSLREWF